MISMQIRPVYFGLLIGLSIAAPLSWADPSEPTGAFVIEELDEELTCQGDLPDDPSNSGCGLEVVEVQHQDAMATLKIENFAEDTGIVFFVPPADRAGQNGCPAQPVEVYRTWARSSDDLISNEFLTAMNRCARATEQSGSAKWDLLVIDGAMNNQEQERLISEYKSTGVGACNTTSASWAEAFGGELTVVQNTCKVELRGRCNDPDARAIIRTTAASRCSESDIAQGTGSISAQHDLLNCLAFEADYELYCGDTLLPSDRAEARCNRCEVGPFLVDVTISGVSDVPDSSGCSAVNRTYTYDLCNHWDYEQENYGSARIDSSEGFETFVRLPGGVGTMYTPMLNHGPYWTPWDWDYTGHYLGVVISANMGLLDTTFGATFWAVPLEHEGIGGPNPLVAVCENQGSFPLVSDSLTNCDVSGSTASVTGRSCPMAGGGSNDDDENSSSDSLPGDFNGNGLVEQSDLDLILLHWGKSAAELNEATWAGHPVNGNVDQDELDQVLLNWGSSGP